MAPAVPALLRSLPGALRDASGTVLPSVRTVLPGVVQVSFPKAVVNAFVVDADVPTVVDTGTPGGIEHLMEGIEAAGFVPGDIRRIVLTHRHADHVGNAAELVRRTGAELLASPEEAAYLTERVEQPRPRVATPLGHALLPYVKAALPWTVAEPLPVEASLVDGAEIGSLRVIATPGHTPGHVSVIDTRRGVLLTGDAAAHITTLGPHPIADDPATARESFRALAGHQFAAACFGHGRPLTAGASAAFAARL